MHEERIAIVDLADELQVRKQRIFKILPRLGIRHKQRREEARGNQMVATVTTKEAIAIRNEIEGANGGQLDDATGVLGGDSRSAFYSDDVGSFYVIQLEPEHDPGRFKVGFTTELSGRLRKHRCSAPFAQYLSTWPCLRVWERAAIDCATDGSEKLHTEVFRSQSLDEVLDRANGFFSMMPTLPETDDDDESAE